MTKILRMAGTEHVWELDDSIDLEQRAREIAAASARNEVLGLTARLPGQPRWSFVSMNPSAAHVVVTGGRDPSQPVGMTG